jgi:hypothetical protein
VPRPLNYASRYRPRIFIITIIKNYRCYAMRPPVINSTIVVTIMQDPPILNKLLCSRPPVIYVLVLL